ncbi:MAG: VanZ family protein [Candidatus Sumerlaeaceae bacterium]|nr:VanZ family protein [Candidatus Sumerlaeaceae bacterium]
MKTLFPLLALGGICALIWWLGGGTFGRNQTQTWIDRCARVPWLHDFLNRHHGSFRAAGHYVEFGGLFLVLFWLVDTVWRHGRMEFSAGPAIGIALICMAAAYLDELHQLRSGTRQFRRVDFLHSCCGIAGAAAVIFYQSVARGLP